MALRNARGLGEDCSWWAQAHKQELSGLCHQLALAAAGQQLRTLLADAHHTQVMPIEALPLRVPPPRSNRLGQSLLAQFADLVVLLEKKN